MSVNIGALYNILDVSAKIYVPTNATQITVPFRGAGTYFIVPCPNVTHEEALASGCQYIFVTGGFLFAETSDVLVGNYTSSYNNLGKLGYWGGSVAFENNERQNIIFKGNANETVTLLGGREYYILRTKR